MALPFKQLVFVRCPEIVIFWGEFFFITGYLAKVPLSIVSN
jgi:hypothetical protein